MSEPDKFEDDLLYALTRTGEGFRTEQAEQAGLVADGYRLGRRRWRRRSAAAVVGGAAALALVGTGTVYLASPGAGDAGTVSAASAPAASVGITAGGSAAATTPTALQSVAQAAVSGDEVLATFRALLPKGEITEATGQGTDRGPKATDASANLVFDDGQGKSLIQFNISKHRPGQVQLPGCPPDLTLVRVDACTDTVLPDGSKLLLQQGYEYSDSRADTKEWFAVLNGPDGRSVSVHEWNAPKEKGAPDSRPNPPLTLDQLKAVVTDKSWDRVVKALRFDGIDTEAIDPGLSPADYETVLTGLLPSGATVTGRKGQDTGVAFELARAGRAGTLSVLVKNWAKAPDDRPAQHWYQDAEILPDGTKLLTHAPAAPILPGKLIADATRPDGLEVLVVTASNGDPLLTAAELKTIVTSPAWKARK
ncbi:hypothetical protein ACGF13_38820 [Kitasatospora sp. NPDC048286]|uniref:hypothetical protein n=1 Tax=Kitasatospora sp. NPDC048286 TaxID=3364047 RepID=UPI00371BD442